MSIGLIISTYNRPDALDAVLWSVAHQSRLPDQIIVADDGSGPETKAIIDRWTDQLPLQHVWQEDLGFRLARIRNLAILHCTSDYVISIDGDIMIDRDFVADHALAAGQNQWVQGSRVMLDINTTNTLIANPSNLQRGLWLSAKIKNRLNGIRHSTWKVICSGKSSRYDDVKGAHMAFWKKDLERINGYDGRYTGWGREDNDIAARLYFAGIQRFNLKGAAIAYHLHHESVADDTEHADALLAEVIAERRIRAIDGLTELS